MDVGPDAAAKKQERHRPFVDGMTGTKMVDGEHPDLEALLGEACLLNVIHTEKDGNTYANIQGASPLPKGLEAPALFNETKLIDIDSRPWEEINKLPDFLLKQMYSSEECANRRRAEQMLAGGKVKDFRPKSVVETAAVEDPAADISF